jgi:hypothetical protein
VCRDWIKSLLTIHVFVRPKSLYQLKLFLVNTRLVPGTSTGLYRSPVLPMPNWPAQLWPQHLTSLPVQMMQVWYPPTAMAMAVMAIAEPPASVSVRTHWHRHIHLPLTALLHNRQLTLDPMNPDPPPPDHLPRCVRACVRACVRSCVRACVCVHVCTITTYR